jgi:hypothetical protein
MKVSILFIAVLLFACSTPQYLHKEVHDGVEIAYFWKHGENAPSELIMRMDNVSQEDRRVSLVIDLYHQGKTVETLQADTCIRVGQSLNGKLNGIFFVPEVVTADQIRNNEIMVEMTRTFIEPLPCE